MIDQEAMERLYHMRVVQLRGLPAEVYEFYGVVHCERALATARRWYS